MTTLSTIFQKPIDRPIEGVIKANDDASLRLEVEEYVLTNEVAKRLDHFLTAYTNYQNANGVWISGFFGSGKSHLLKMLALLLENQDVDGISVLDAFLEKCGDNALLKGDLRKAVAIPSKSILFNIDQKATVISKTQIDALLAVFVKVFDEMCGYFGKQGYIAQFERDLDGRGQYTAFKSAYAQIALQPWEFGREIVILEGDNIAKAYAQATGNSVASAAGILDKYRADYNLSIEDFAAQINKYIERQGRDFRLNFFVDEVGQYIADNTKLMTNLQTIAESLATKSRGRAWVIVTAQEDMNTVIGELRDKQENDFSKIQARFANRMKLTSADVAEVIQRRLLAKNVQGARLSEQLYGAQVNNFKTLFDFADGSQTYRNFRSESHFVDSYPFVPYQFVLFQSAIQGLSVHNAFEGKHSSVGERSMLGVFQQVAVQIGAHQVGELATFDLMFEGIRTALKSSIQRAIVLAERHLDAPFAVRILKALFLVKYVKEFKASTRNIAVLMLPSFACDLPQLHEQIDTALRLLERETYIERNGDLFAFLTDEEKDVEEEIKAIDVDDAAIADTLGKLLFDHVIKSNKIRYDEIGYDYPFARRLDERLISREQELTIRIISPFHEHAGNEMVLRAQSMGRSELLVVMPPDDRLIADLTMFKKTEKYVRQNTKIAQQESIKRILTDKQFVNQQRYAGLQTQVRDQLTTAMLIVEGSDLEIGGGDPQRRIVQGFHRLVERTYPNLQMLRGYMYRESDIANFLNSTRATLPGMADEKMNEAEYDMLGFIKSNSTLGQRTTLKHLVERYEHKPYGWYLAAVQCLLAKLLAGNHVEARQDSTLLEEGALARMLRNTRVFDNVILSPQATISPRTLRDLKAFYGDFFDRPSAANDAKSMGRALGDEFKKMLDKLRKLENEARRYPFHTQFTQAVSQLQALTGKPYTYYIQELVVLIDELLDLKEDVLEPLHSFMEGPQRHIFDEVQHLLERQQPNFVYIDGDELEQLRQLAVDPRCYEGNRIQRAKVQLASLKAKLDAKVRTERSTAIAQIDNRWQRLESMVEFEKLSKSQRAQLFQPFEAVQKAFEQQTLIAVIRERVRLFDEKGYREAQQQMVQWARPKQTPVYPVHKPDSSSEPATEMVREPRHIFLADVVQKTQFGKATLQSQADIDAYIATLRRAMGDVIEQGNYLNL
ncbi:MAG: BREX system P-loop protein BrxC [Candidatus Promineifilaceae bacterium]